MVFSNDSLTNPDLNAGATLKVGMGAKFGLKKNVAEGSFMILKPSNLSDKLQINIHQLCIVQDASRTSLPCSPVNSPLWCLSPLVLAEPHIATKGDESASRLFGTTRKRSYRYRLTNPLVGPGVHLSGLQQIMLSLRRTLFGEAKKWWIFQPCFWHHPNFKRWWCYLPGKNKENSPKKGDELLFYLFGSYDRIIHIYI